MTQDRPLRVLLVEDDETGRFIFSEALKDAGFEVLEAETADQAMPLLDEPDHVAALVTDVRLPGTLDGIDLAREVRKIYPMMPVLVASGYGSQLTERLQLLKPPMVFMAKPFALRNMVETLRRLTEGK